jgi:glutamate 5-kinase
MINADLLILLTDIDGLYTDDPRKNPEAKLIHTVDIIDDEVINMAKGATSRLGTGGMTTKVSAARIATNSNSDMVIISGDDMDNIVRVLAGEEIGTMFKAYKDKDFDVVSFILNKEYLV